jgi:HAD superfamily hydrolase (TIGR01509 family)
MCAILIFAKMKNGKNASSVPGERMKPESMNGNSALECVLFDWDGTLLDSFEADAQAYIHMFAALGLPWSIAELKRHYSPNWHHVYRAARLPRAKWKEADRLWKKFYRSYKPRRQLREHKVAAMFRTKVCSEDAPRRKPHPAPLRIALDRLRLSPKVCVYVGDAPEDIQMAHRAGMRAIGVLGGSPVPERLRGASPDATIETIRELPGLLRNF